MGLTGCKWVLMGLDGCVGVQGHGGTQKQGKKRHKWLFRTWRRPLWPGKFPRTSCLQKVKKHVWITPDGYLWVSLGAGGYMDTEGSKNKTKRGPNGRV